MWFIWLLENIGRDTRDDNPVFGFLSVAQFQLLSRSWDYFNRVGEALTEM